MEKRTGTCACVCREVLGVLWLPYWGIIVTMLKAWRCWVWVAVEKDVGSPLTMTLMGYVDLHVSLKWSLKWFWMPLWWKIRGSWKSKKFYNQTTHGPNPVCCLPASILGFFPDTDAPSLGRVAVCEWKRYMLSLGWPLPLTTCLPGRAFSLQVDVECAEAG